MPQPRFAPLADKTHALPGPALAALLDDARRRTLELVKDLDDAELEVPYLPVVNPFRWELGHVGFFYEANLLRLLEGIDPIAEGGDAFYNSFEVDHDDRWSLPLPPREEVLAYLEQVRDLAAERLGGRAPDPQETYLYLLAVRHEDMHAEAFTYMRQTLGYPAPRLTPPPAEPGTAGGGPLPGDVEVPGGAFQLGASAENPFVFDNEKWAHPVEVAPFSIARAAVTNAEFAEFVDDGGYRRPDLWSHQGWTWCRKNGVRSPLYWERGVDGWLRRSFDRFVPLKPHTPVAHVSWWEAEAFCDWAGRRLPTEAEWELAASAEGDENGGISPEKRRYPWGDEPPSPRRANLGFTWLGHLDVGALPEGDSAFGCRQMAGNVWEWTASAFYPFPGYLVDFPYREYSAPWFGYRKVLKGGAWASSSRLAYNGYRNFFTPDRRDVYAGFRTCAR